MDTREYLRQEFTLIKHLTSQCTAYLVSVEKEEEQAKFTEIM